MGRAAGQQALHCVILNHKNHYCTYKRYWRLPEGRKRVVYWQNRQNKGWLIEWWVIWEEPFSVSRCAVFSKYSEHTEKWFLFAFWTFLHQETALFLVNISENGSSLNAGKQNSFSLQTQYNLISEKHSELVETELYRFHKSMKSELFPTLQTQLKTSITQLLTMQMQSQPSQEKICYTVRAAKALQPKPKPESEWKVKIFNSESRFNPHKITLCISSFGDREIDSRRCDGRIRLGRTVVKCQCNAEVSDKKRKRQSLWKVQHWRST